MQSTVHVWIRKRDEIFLIIAGSSFQRCIYFESLLLLPFRLHITFDFLQEFHLEGSLSFDSSLASRQIKHIVSIKLFELSIFIIIQLFQMITIFSLVYFDCLMVFSRLTASKQLFQMKN